MATFISDFEVMKRIFSELQYKQNLCFHEPKAFGFCPLTTQPIFNKSFLKNEIIERIGLFFAMTTSIHF
jgi:hypothetical protein